MHQMKQYDLNFSNMQLFHKLTKKTFCFRFMSLTALTERGLRKRVRYVTVYKGFGSSPKKFQFPTK